MEVKLTPSACETLSDIILHHLQEQGLSKAEAIEQSLFQQLEQLPNTVSSSHQLKNGLAAVVSNPYVFIYQSSEKLLVVVDILHTSRSKKILPL